MATAHATEISKRLNAEFRKLKAFSGRFSARQRVWSCFDSAHTSPFLEERRAMQIEGEQIEAEIFCLLSELSEEGDTDKALARRLKRGIEGCAVTQGMRNRLTLLQGLACEDYRERK